ncbi:MAG: hypothetical protein QOH66_2307 [Actinomycetota bacterium]|jgi:hypothetical protein|nr:hypothetical protein [Actinomycetota bacterium]
MTVVHVAATPLWQQLLSPVVGGGVGGGIAYLSAVRSLNRAAGQAEQAQQKEWAEERRLAGEDRAQQRRAALLALLWEFDVDRELLERQGSAPLGVPTLLPHVALDAALPWYLSLPEATGERVHQAQVAVLRYNTDAERLRALMANAVQGISGTPAAQAGAVARGAMESSAKDAVYCLEAARIVLKTVLEG